VAGDRLRSVMSSIMRGTVRNSVREAMMMQRREAPTSHPSIR